MQTAHYDPEAPPLEGRLADVVELGIGQFDLECGEIDRDLTNSGRASRDEAIPD